ncbi:nicotinamide riboside transporter PnuC [Parasphingopyxis sp. CP4]|uniref:nicotinamide riboside transporter PnuC n=1 Tax=Parasphingopyxis sp. CP4 TaxID=2724527 RepID=UPI0021029502|nr:nicotinamide riboside transporter PnuC [Parasphingopyxis sp. CP4]
MLIEALAVALGIANVTLIVRRNVWNYPFGIVMVSLYGYIFFDAKLYGEAGLQIFFVVIQFYGWWRWSRAIEHEGTLNVRWTDLSSIVLWLGVTAGVTMGLAYALGTWTDAVAPYPDATVSAASITAQILLALRRIENWIYWIFVDIIAIWLFLSRELYLTAGLYAVFLVLATTGLIVWWRAGRKRAAEQSQI